MKIRREYFITVGVLLVLLVITIITGLIQGNTEEIPPLSSNSNKPDGARALRLWLSAVGYQVSNQSPESFQVPEGTDAVLMLEPDLYPGPTSDEWKTMDQWVDQGGILFLAASQMRSLLVTSALPVEMDYRMFHDYSIFPAAPVFRAPPMTQPAKLTLGYFIKPVAGHNQPLLSTPDGIVAMRLEQQRGSIILVADSSFLTNEGLTDPGNAELALNLFAFIPKASRIWIDEWHHGERGDKTVQGYGLEAWLTGTPGGLAVLFSALTIFLGLLFAGRPFGRPVPLPRDQQRRSALEYVTALANLNRRAGHSQALMLSYHTALKRAYGRRYRLDPGLPDPEYVERLSAYNPELDGPALLDLLVRLDQKSYTDLQVVQLARDAADWLAKLER